MLETLGVFNVLFYSSFLMTAGSVWVDCGGRDFKRDGSKADSILIWIELEFLIFMLNIFGTAGYLFVRYMYNWIDGIGLKFYFNPDTATEDVLTEDIKQATLFQHNFCNVFVGAYLLWYPQNEKASAASGIHSEKYWIESAAYKVNSSILLYLSLAQFAIYFFVFFFKAVWPSLNHEKVLKEMNEQADKDERTKIKAKDLIPPSKKNIYD